MIDYKGYNYAKQGQTYTVYNKQGEEWIVGFKTEEEAKKQIDDLVLQEEKAMQEKTEMEALKEQITDLQLALAELVEGGNV